MKKITLILMCILLIACGQKTNETSSQSETTPSQEKIMVEMSVQDYGTMEIELDPSIAPISVENFVNLVKEGFYDGSKYHRIIDGFMIQGGAPKDEASYAKLKTIKGEFSANGIENPLKHATGVISMARAKDMDSASSQVFICVADAPHLDGMYAAFGKVTKGIEIALQIAKDAKPIDHNGRILEEEMPIIEYIKVIES